MRIAFVGITRKYKALAPDYIEFFNRFHLELPAYFSAHNDVTIVTVDHETSYQRSSALQNRNDIPGYLRCIKVANFGRPDGERTPYDLIVHWRKWTGWVPDAVNVINCQDHSFSAEWLSTVRSTHAAGQLYGIMCFPGWHEANLRRELGDDGIRLIPGLTLGVDEWIYRPSEYKDPRMLLWASDPGRGFKGACMLAAELYKRDRRFRLHVCRPDYAVETMIQHPAIVDHGFIPNGPELWKLFADAAFLPYTSTFKEPSSRAHRQAQAAGCCVLYPPDMGTPSDLIDDGVTGYVRPVDEWADLIMKSVDDYSWQRIGAQARKYAVAESWTVQSQRFNSYFEPVCRELKKNGY